MIRKHLLSIVFSLFCLAGFAQGVSVSENIHVYGDPGDSLQEWGEQIIPVAGGNYVIAGTWQSQAMLAKVNACGDTLWKHTFIEGDQARFHSVIERAGGTLLATGDCFNCMPGENRNKAFSVITDANGLETARSVLGDSGVALEGKFLFPTSDGGYVGIANTTSHPTCFWTPGDIWLVKVDANYQIQWDVTLDVADYDVAQRVIETSDGGYVATGTVWDSGQPQRHAVWRFNASGGLLWTRTFYPYIGFCRGEAPNAVVQMDNGNLAVVGGYYPDSTAAWEGFLLQLRLSDGFTLDSVFMGSSLPQYNELMYDVQKRPNGNLVVAGQKGGFANFYQPWVLEYDPSFNLVGEFAYPLIDQAGKATSLSLMAGDSLQFVFCGKGEYIFNGSDMLVGSRVVAPSLVTFTERAQDKQLYPRNWTTGLGTARFAGTVSQGPTVVYSDLELLVYREDSLVADQLYPLSYVGSTASFAIDFDFPSELANYTFQLQGLWQGCAFTETRAEEVVAGDAYIVTGQSNALANDHPPLPGNQSEFIRVFGKQFANDTSYVWRKEQNDPAPFADNRSGNLGLSFAKQIVDHHGYPVAILNGATSGIAIQQMLPNTTNPLDTSTNYGRLLLRMRKAGLEDAVSSILFFQGETNALLGDLDTNGYFSYFDTLQAAWAQHYSYPVGGAPWKFLYQIRPGCFGSTGPGVLQIQEAQRRIPFLFPGWKVISTTAMDHTGCHYSAAGYAKGGEQAYLLADAYLYPVTVPLPDMESPNPYEIIFDSAFPNRLVVDFFGGNGPLFPPVWYPGNEQDFRLEGDSANSVVSGAFSNDSLILELANPYQLGTTLSYSSHPLGDLVAVRTGFPYEVGMLAFWNRPVKVGMEEPLDQLYGLDIFPNPGQGLLRIQSKYLPAGDVHLQLTDALGRVLQEESLRSNGAGFRAELEIKGPSGLYLLQVRHENGARATKRVVKE